MDPFYVQLTHVPLNYLKSKFTLNRGGRGSRQESPAHQLSCPSRPKAPDIEINLWELWFNKVGKPGSGKADWCPGCPHGWAGRSLPQWGGWYLRQHSGENSSQKRKGYNTMVHNCSCQRIVVLLVLVTILREEPDVNVMPTALCK